MGVFGLTVAATGWNEKRLRAAGRPYRAIHTHPASHAGYYPGRRADALKLLVDPETDAILGAQGVGGEGRRQAHRRHRHGDGRQAHRDRLADLELAYAPQFGSAKDPVNMLGYIADNLRTGVSRDHPVARAGGLSWRRRPWSTSAPRGEHARGAIPGSILDPGR